MSRWRAWAWVAGLAGAMASCGDDGSGKLTDAPTGPDTPGSVAMLTIDRATASFGSITLGTTSAPITFTITNSGGAASGVLAPALSGADAGNYALGASTCNVTLAPAATCTVEVTFAPTSIGTKAATLAVAATPGGMVTAALDGEGVGTGALTLTATQSSLGSAVVGQTGTIVSTFTATNTGTGTTGALSVIAAGSDPADFAKSMDLCSGSTLAPAASCTFQVRLAPQTAGAKGALFQVTGSPGGNVSGAVTGTALAPASLRAVPLQLELGSVAVGSASPALTVTVANLGDESTGALAQTVTGADFAATGGTCNGASLAGHTTCTVTIDLRPTSTGAKTGLLSITGAPGGTVMTTLVGDGAPANGLTITPSAKQFPNTNVGAVSAAQQFAITNNGAVPTSALAATLGGGDASQYRIVAAADTCTGAPLAPASTCTVSVVFAPTSSGVAHGAITVAGSPGGAVTAGLLGVGAGAPALSISPPSRGFGSVVVGAMSPALTFTVTNLGGQVSGVPAASLAGAGAAQFAIAGNTCTATLAPGASCTVQVRFAPIAIGAESATLSVAATPGGTATAALSGDGIATGGIAIVPASMTLPTTAVGDTSAAQTLTVLNTGSATTSAISVSSSGAELATTSTCTTLAPGATCAISVTFAPSATGARTGMITATATTGGTATAAVAGQGIPRLEILALDSGPVVDPADFGTAIINNSTPHDLQILVRNNTATAKTLGVTPSFGTPAQYAVVSNTCGTTIGAAGGLCTVGVRFAPTSTGPKPGSITFDIGTGAANHAVQNLTGVGVEALQIAAPDGTDFGSVPVNTTAPATLRFRVTNPAGSQTSGPVAVALAGGAAFALGTDGCTGQTLAAGASCVVDVAFAPTAVAAAMTTLTATASPGGMPFITITGAGVAPTGAAPTDLSLSPSTIAEDAPAGSTVGTLSTTDTDAGDTFTYALVGGVGATDNAAFTISGALVNTAGVLDFEVKSSYAIRVRVTDGGGNIFEKALTVTVTNVDELPVAVDDAKTVAEDDPAAAIDVLANDTDPDGGPKMIASVTQPAHGTVVITGGGSGLTYQPAANYAGADSFTYTLNGGSLGTVTVTVTPVDDAPLAVADTFAVAEDGAAGALAVLANDTDIDAGPMTITSVTQPMHGAVVITGGGTGLTYAPAANYSGPDAFSYTLNGGSTAVVSMTVTPADDPPVAVDDLIGLLEDEQPKFLDVVANDTDTDGGPKMVMSFTQPQHGTLTASLTGVIYTVAPDYNGPDTFTYTLNGGSAGTVNLVIQPINDVPSFTKGANQSVLEDATAQTVAGWATMLSKGPLNESAQQLDFQVTNDNSALFSAPPAISPAGELTYTPAANANGMATVTVRIHDDGGTVSGGVDTSAPQTFTITVTPVNDVPSFTKGADQTVLEDAGPQTVPGWATAISAGPANESSQTVDFQVSNNNAALFSVAPAISAAGELTYTPAPNKSGIATVTIKIHDDGGTADGGVDTSAAQTFTIGVTAVNDPPSFTKGANQTVLEDAGAQSVAWATMVSAGPADEAGQTVDFQITNNTNATLFSTQPAIAADGTLTYRPTDNANGTATLTVVLHDSGGGTDTSAPVMFTITVTPVNDAPTASNGSATTDEDTSVVIPLSASDIDSASLTYSIVAGPAHGTLTGTGASRTYTPAANYNGPDSFTFKANDGSLDSNTATISIAVNAVNDKPVANAASVATDEDTPKAITLTASDVDSASLTYSIVTAPAHGTLSGSGASLTYTPAANYFGPDGFTFQANDGSLDSDPATVSITVNAVNDKPVADGQQVTTDEDTPKAIVMTGSDVENASLTYAIVTPPAHGTLSGTGASRTYTPAANYNGPDSFTFKANDGSLDSDPATVAITVNAVNDKPVADAQSVTTDEDAPKAIALTASDIDSASLTYAVVTGPMHGTLSGSGASLTYTPAANYFGPDSFTFRANDSSLDSDPATVSITVTSVNDTPVANDLSVTTDEDTPKAIIVTATDVETPSLTYTLVSGPSHGALSGTLPSVTYTPATNYFGPDSFTFKANDGTVDSNTATVSITVVSKNDPPVAFGASWFSQEDSPASFTLIGFDADGDALTFSIAVGPTHGTLGTFAAADCSSHGANKCGAVIVYTPDPNYSGPDSFRWTVSDGTASGSADMPFTVLAVDDFVDAIADTASTDEDTPSQPIDVLANDLGLGDGGIVVSIPQQPSQGSALVDANSRIIYTPAPNANGTVTFDYQVKDADGDTDTATITVTINPVDDPPTAVDDAPTVNQGSSGNVLDVLLNDLNSDGGPKQVSGVTQPQNGSVTIAVDNSSVKYTPNATYCNSTQQATDNFTYTLNGGSQATVKVKVTCTSATSTIVTGIEHTCALLTGGLVKCWGYNGVGSLGVGDTLNRGDNPGELGSALPAVPLGTGRTAVQIAAGTHHTCAILDDASLKCWGYNWSGQLGLGDTNYRGDQPGEMGDNLPAVSLGTGRTATAVAGGDSFTCAVLDNGQVKCWGYNNNGELGIGDTLNRGDQANEMGDNLPAVPLGTGRTAVAIAAGGLHACALLDDGSVRCWGYNGNGQLGQGDTLQRGDQPNELGDNLPPIALGTGRTAVEIDLGVHHSCARLDNGSMKCWGLNSEGELGLGDTASRGDGPNEMGDNLSPVALGTGRTVRTVSAGWLHTCATLDDGTLKCWGYNNEGQLGLGDRVYRGRGPGEMGDNLPVVPLGTGRTVTAVAPGVGLHTCAVLDNATIKCWGQNYWGQLGLGDTNHRGDAPGEMGDALPVVSP